MTIEEANVSLKLECALRELGFMEIKERIVAHAGIYFVRPVGFSFGARLWDDLLGFQIEKSEEWEYTRTGLCLITNYISSPSGLTKYQKFRGIDTTQRVRVE